MSFKKKFMTDRSVLSGVVSPMVIFQIDGTLSEVLSESKFTWLVGNNYGVPLEQETFLFISYSWLCILVLLAYINFSIHSILFLLEAGLLTPVVLFALCEAATFGAVLFIINAITMDSVVGVIVVLGYCTNWGGRDVTKIKVLESGFSGILKKSIKNLHSWSLFFNYYFENNLIFFYFFSKYLLFFIFTLVFFTVSTSTAILDFYSFDTFVTVYSKISQNNQMLGLSNTSQFFKKILAHGELKNKSPLIDKILEFTSTQSVTYFEFLGSTSHSFVVDSFHKYADGSLNLSGFGKGLHFGFRESHDYFDKLGYISNPHNTLNNLVVLSGLYFDPTVLYKNNMSISELGTTSGGQSVKSKSFENSSLSTDLQNSDSRVLAMSLSYDKQCADIAKVLVNHSSTSQQRGGGRLELLFDFDKYTNVFNLFTPPKTTAADKYSGLLNYTMSSLFGTDLASSSKRSNLNFFFRKNNTNSLAYFVKNNFFFYKKPNKGLKNSLWPNLQIFFIKNNKIQHHRNNVTPYVNFYSIRSLESRLLGKYCTIGSYLVDSSYKAGLGRFTKIVQKNFNLRVSRHSRNFYTSVRYGVGSNPVADRFSEIHKSVTNPFFLDLGLKPWGFKNKNSIFGIKTKTLPWFDHSNPDEFFLDKNPDIVFRSMLQKSDLNFYDPSVASNSYILTNLLGIKNSNLNRDGEFFKKKESMFVKKRKKRRLGKIVGRSRSKKKVLKSWSKIRLKSKVWKINLNWVYSGGLDKLYNFQSRNLNTIFFENKYSLNRLGNGLGSLPITEYRQISKFGDTGFDNSITTVNSKQSQNFGLIGLDDVFFKDVVVGTASLNQTFTKNPLYGKKLFSFKKASNVDNIQNYFYSSINKQGVKKHNTYTGFDPNNLGNTLSYCNKISHIPDRETGVSSAETDDIFYTTGGEFFNKLKVFWNGNSQGTAESYDTFNGKGVVEDRFMKTFSKLSKKRKKSFLSSLNRASSVHIQNNSVLKFLQNNLRLGVLPNSFIKENSLFSSDNFNKLTLGEKKIILENDFEIFEQNSRSGYKKPHTVYGILWDEYLKHTYGFSLSFIDFKNKIKNKSDLGGKATRSFWFDFNKNLEKSTIKYDKQTGLTLDTGIVGDLTTRFLTKSGFFKNIARLDNNLDLGASGFSKNHKFIRNLKHRNSSINFSGAKKVNRYLKGKLLGDVSTKADLSKKSVGYLKLFSETPVGFKYDTTDISQKLPYVKKNIASHNEDIYHSINITKKRGWLSLRNGCENILNRAKISKISNIKKSAQPDYFFRKKKYKTSLLKLNNWQFNGFVDTLHNTRVDFTGQGRSFRKRRKPFHFFDKNNFFFIKNQIFGNLKRNYYETLPNKNKEFLRRFEYLDKSTGNLFKKNRNKYINNLGIFFKTNLNNNFWSGDVSTRMYSNSLRVDKDVFYAGIYRSRFAREFGPFSNFEHRGVKQLRSGEAKKLQKILLNEKSNYKIYRNLTESSEVSGDFWGKSLALKSYRVDLNFLENTMNFKNYKNKNISENYKLKNVSNLDLFGFENQYYLPVCRLEGLVIFNKKKYEIENKVFDNFYKTKNTTDLTSFIKNKKFSGLVDFSKDFNQFYGYWGGRVHKKNNVRKFTVYLNVRSVFFKNFTNFFFRINPKTAGPFTIKQYNNLEILPKLEMKNNLNVKVLLKLKIKKVLIFLIPIISIWFITAYYYYKKFFKTH